MTMFKKAVSPLGRYAHRKSPAIERFWAKVERVPDSSCWRWTGYISATSGYGQMGDQRKVVLVHRWSYEHFVGPIPEGLHIDHLCKNRWCVNPNHLEAVEQAENNRRSPKPKVRICPRGHDKQVVGVDATGTCSECRRLANRRYRAARKEAAR